MSEENTASSSIEIADEVLSVIALTAALEVEGVVGGNTKGLVEFFEKKGQTRCSKIARDGDEAVFDMDIIVSFGTRVQLVAEEVQKKVKSAVENMTGLKVPVVNVCVSGVVKEKTVKAEEA